MKRHTRVRRLAIPRRRMQRLHRVARFLNGEDQLDGVWFHEGHPTLPGAYWWRRFLREAVDGLDAPLRKAKPVRKTS